MNNDTPLVSATTPEAPMASSAPLSTKAPARWTLRLANNILDNIFAFIIGTLVVFVLQTLFARSAQESVGFGLFSYLVYYLYFVVSESMWQRTPGKFITGTKVVRKDGSRATTAQIFGRSLARFIPFDQFSFIAGTPIGWHDSVSGTMVVPNDYTPEDVRAIGPQKRSSLVLIIVVALFGMAIIGIIAAVVLASLATARQKALDARGGEAAPTTVQPY